MKPSTTIYSCAQFVQKDKMTVQGFIEYAAKTGFEGVDLGYYWSKDPAEKEKELRSVPKWLKSNGIALSGYIVGNNFGAVVGTEKDKDEIAKVKTAIDEASRLGAKVLRVFAGGREGLTWEAGSPLIRDCYAECLKHAAKRKVVLALEDHGGLAADSKQVLYYVKELNSPFFRVNVDIGNFLEPAGEDPIGGVTKTAPFAAMVHIKDLKKVGGKYVSCPVGDGFIDFTKCFQILKDAGYDGFVSLEYEAPEDAAIGIPKSLKHVKKCLAAVK
jgi:sugar phosphate isomerase/epimerase